MSTTIQTRQTTNEGGAARVLGITNGSKRVSLTIGAGSLMPNSVDSLALTPEEATALAVALLNGAENVERGDWGGKTGDPARALAYLEGKR